MGKEHFSLVTQWVIPRGQDTALSWPLRWPIRVQDSIHLACSQGEPYFNITKVCMGES